MLARHCLITLTMDRSTHRFAGDELAALGANRGRALTPHPLPAEVRGTP